MSAPPPVAYTYTAHHQLEASEQSPYVASTRQPFRQLLPLHKECARQAAAVQDVAGQRQRLDARDALNIDDGAAAQPNLRSRGRLWPAARAARRRRGQRRFPERTRRSSTAAPTSGTQVPGPLQSSTCGGYAWRFGFRASRPMALRIGSDGNGHPPALRTCGRSRSTSATPWRQATSVVRRLLLKDCPTSRERGMRASRKLPAPGGAPAAQRAARSPSRKRAFASLPLRRQRGGARASAHAWSRAQRRRAQWLGRRTCLCPRSRTLVASSAPGPWLAAAPLSLPCVRLHTHEYE